MPLYASFPWGPPPVEDDLSAALSYKKLTGIQDAPTYIQNVNGPDAWAWHYLVLRPLLVDSPPNPNLASSALATKTISATQVAPTFQQGSNGPDAWAWHYAILRRKTNIIDSISAADILLDATVDDDPDLWEYYSDAPAGGNKQLQTYNNIFNQGNIPPSYTINSIDRFNVSTSGLTGANANAITFRVGKDDPDTAGTDAKRTEINFVGIPAIGATTWWAWRAMIPQQYWGYTDNRILYCQLKDGFGAGAFSPPYFAYYANTSGGNWVIQASSQTTNSTPWNYVPGQWYDFVVQYQRSETGFLRLWIDGVQVVNFTGRVAAPSTGNDGTAGYKHGTYHWINAGNTWDNAQGDYNTIHYDYIVAVNDTGYTEVEIRDHLKVHTGRSFATIPDAPTNLIATPFNTQINVAWTEAPDGGSPLISKQMRHRVSPAGSWIESSALPGNGANHTTTGLINGTAYDFQVRAINAIGPSPWSSTVTSTPV